MVNRNECMSSFLAFRYIEKNEVDFAPHLHHKHIEKISEHLKTIVYNETDIDKAIADVFASVRTEKPGILLSGGMDNAILASYMHGCDAYTFRFPNEFQKEELTRAESYAKQYGLNLHYVDISWANVMETTPVLMKHKGAPVHSIEPQIYKAALQAKADGITCMVVGESADLIFGGMDQLLSKDWTVKEFAKRYIFVEPSAVLREPTDVRYLFERYRTGNNIDFLSFMDDVFSIESSSSYLNAFDTASLPYLDPYAKLKMGMPLDLNRVRNGESKYLVRDLFRRKYPQIPVPEKIPMPRPVDAYFKDWEGPIRPEFLPRLDINRFDGNQKWLIHCLEWFLNLLEEGVI